MRMEDHKAKGKAVWLSHEDADLFMDAASQMGTRHYIALGFMLRSGLRRDEATSVRPGNIVRTPSGPRIRVFDGKGGKDRATPIPDTLLSRAQGYADLADHLDGWSDERNTFITVSNRTVARWTKKAADYCREQTGDQAWDYLTPHDLRRSWGTLLVEAEVEPGTIMEWGGWENWEDFRDRYLGALTDEHLRGEIAKVNWL